MKRALVIMLMAVGTAAADVPPGLVLRFTCDELKNGGTVLPDTTGSNNNGRVTGAKWSPAGRLGGGCEFFGENSTVQVLHAPSLKCQRATVCLWFKASSAGSVDRVLMAKGAEDGYALYIAGSAQKEAGKGKLRAVVNGLSCLSDTAVADNAWHHGAFTYDGENVKLYVDGTLQKQSIAWQGDFAANTHDLTLGMNRSGPAARVKNMAFEGMLDEVMLFNRALTETELKDVIAATRPKFTRQQVERRLKELKDLLDRGLILQDFYERKVKECEVTP